MLRSLKQWFVSFLFHLLRDQKSLFGASFLLGMGAALLYHSNQVDTDSVVKYSYDFAYEKWLYSRGLYSHNIDPDVNRFKDKNGTDIEAAVRPNTEAEFLFKTVSVLCIVFPTSTAGAATVADTWGRHCNQLRLFSHQLQNSTLKIEKIASKSAFGLLCSALLKLEMEQSSSSQLSSLHYDWILIVTEDTFVLPENFRYFVAPMNSSENHYLGHAMRFWSHVYNWGDAGYAISRGTVQTLLKKFNSKAECEDGGKYWKNGDWYLGKHLADLGIHPVDTRDEQGKGRFNGYSFKKLLFPGAVSIFERYWKDSLYLSPDGPQCCSNRAISFHGILSTSKVYQLEYLFYHLRPFYQGGSYGNSPAPAPLKTPHLSWEESMKELELEHMFNSFLTTPANMEAGSEQREA